MLLETARGAAARGKRFPPPKPIPKSRPIPHHNTPCSVCFYPPSLSVGQIPWESQLPKARISLPGSARAEHTLYIPTLHTHTFPALSGFSTTIYSALSPSLINLACQFKPFPFCCADFFFYFFLKEKDIFQAAFSPSHPLQFFAW